MPSRLRIPVGYVAGLVVLVLVLARPRPLLLAVGLAVAAAGEAVRVWASGHIEKTRRLATGGAYAHSRNPLYFGSILMALGVAIASASPWVILALVVYLTAFYPAVVRSEAAYLMEKVPPGVRRVVPHRAPLRAPAHAGRSTALTFRVGAGGNEQGMAHRPRRACRCASALPAHPSVGDVEARVDRPGLP